MGIDAVSGKGVPRVRVSCDECPRSETITCDYERGSGGTWTPNRGQALLKITQKGWSEIKGKIRCPKCEAKRKVVPMTKKPEPKDEATPAPTKAQRRSIVSMLGEVYDTEAERYTGAETDDTVAAALEVRPGWVAEIREEFFGSGGGNDAMDQSIEDLAKMIDTLRQAHDAANKAAAEARIKMKEAEEMVAQVKKVRDAAGTRLLRKAGVA